MDVNPARLKPADAKQVRFLVNFGKITQKQAAAHYGVPLAEIQRVTRGR